MFLGYFIKLCILTYYLLHPKFAVAKPIKLAEVKTEIQRGFYKQRLTMKNDEERELLGETEEEAEKREIKSHAHA